MNRTRIGISRRHFFPAFALLLVTAVAADESAYRLEEVPLPRGMSPEISAVTFSPAGSLFVANRHGDVWKRDSESSEWSRFAHGLHEPLGLIADSESEVYISHKPELTRIRDTTGDGAGDTFETVAAAWSHTDNWHEHAFGLHRDAEGNFIMALGLVDTAGPINTLWPRVPLDFTKLADEKKLSLSPLQGWLFKVTPEGQVIPWASGFREPCGIGVSPEGEIFVTDQQGDYVASSPLLHIEQGRFYGHPAGGKWAGREGMPGEPLTAEDLPRHKTPETVILPHGSMGGSPGEPVWDTTDGKFGPFRGQVFVGDFTKLISRIDLERVDGQWQGACFSFLRDAVGEEAIAAYSGASNVTIPAGKDGKEYFQDVEPLSGTPLRQGSMRMAFAPDGSLYVGQTTRGWAAGGDGMQRLVWTGRTPVDIHSMRLTEQGFRIRFTTPMDRELASNPENYEFVRFRYVYHGGYGSPRADETEVPVKRVILNDRGDEAELVLKELEPGFIHELHVDPLRSAKGEPLRYAHAYYTLNRALDGRKFEGSITEGPVAPQVTEKARDPDPRLGLRVYRTFCIQCHRQDGRGGGLPGVAAADFTKPDGVLKKEDDELADRIARGLEGKTMPPFGYVLSEMQIRDVLAYIRTEFGPDTGGE